MDNCHCQAAQLDICHLLVSKGADATYLQVEVGKRADRFSSPVTPAIFIEMRHSIQLEANLAPSLYLAHTYSILQKVDHKGLLLDTSADSLIRATPVKTRRS